MRAASSRSATRAHCALLGSAALGNSTGSVGAELPLPSRIRATRARCGVPHHTGNLRPAPSQML